MENNIKINFENYLNKKDFSSSQKEIKESNFNNFIKNGFPNKRIEDWKFSDLKQIITTNFENIDFLKKEEQSNIEANITLDLEHNKIVFINGTISKIDFSYEDEKKIVVEQNSNFKYSFKDINLEKNSHLEYFVLSKGSKFSKHDINCSLNNEYGSVVLNGIIDLNDKRHHEIKTKINHNEENCKSYQLIKSVLNDNSKGVYQGKIYVDSKAQKTDGYQLSRALLLSDEVEFNAKPEVEIYADDVKCSHGSTSGNIDENSIFYLMSRGLSYDQSKKLLTNGFLNEVIEKITNEDVKSLVKKLTGINE